MCANNDAERAQRYSMMTNKIINEVSVNDTEVYAGEAEHMKWIHIPNSSKQAAWQMVGEHKQMTPQSHSSGQAQTSTSIAFQSFLSDYTVY
jgi:hypothetical protein